MRLILLIISTDHRPTLPQADPNSQQKFSDPTNPCVPPLLDGWLSALKEGANELKPSTNSWALWVPEPGLIMGSTSQDRRERYVKNWLKHRTFSQNWCCPKWRLWAMWSIGRGTPMKAKSLNLQGFRKPLLFSIFPSRRDANKSDWWNVVTDYP